MRLAEELKNQNPEKGVERTLLSSLELAGPIWNPEKGVESQVPFSNTRMAPWRNPEKGVESVNPGALGQLFQLLLESRKGS